MDLKVIPTHVAIVMDGNGRWAAQRNLPRIAGHAAGIDVVRKIVRACGEIGIKYLSLFTFSTENWQRPTAEVRFLMRLLRDTIRKEVDELMKNDVRLLAVGRLGDLPSEVRTELDDALKRTSQNRGLNLVLALSYGGRNEIVDAVRMMVQDAKAGKLSSSDVDENTFRNYLYMPELPDPDLLIRTSGEMRLSNFFLWQTFYTELWVTPVLWPDFSREHLLQALKDYDKRERRFGKV